LAEAKQLAGDRFVPALLTPGKLAREGACNAIKDEVGAKLVEKFGAEKVTQFVINDAFYYIQKEAVRSLILKAASVSMAAILTGPSDLQRSRHPAARARFGDFRPRRNAGGHARHARHRRRHAGI
jgi:hypothetical protein